MRWFQKFTVKKGAGLTQIRKGMWVVRGDEVGILVDVAGSGEAQVHLVNELGLTRDRITAPVTELRQARHMEIPAPRRPVREVASRLGYV